MRSRKDKRKKELQKKKSFTGMMILFTVLITYLILNSSILDTHINELTTSYISFYTSHKTDQLIIRNIKKLSMKIGKSKYNPYSLSFPVLGNKNQEYEIILYPKENKVEDKYIYYLFQEKKEISSSSIEKLEQTSDGGRILYKGKINKSNIIVRLWISKEYKDIVSDNMFEIKINPR